MEKTNKIENIFNNVEIVVAHYNEDIDRVRPYADYTIIYHK
jgi:thioesterase domain-containing protein